MERQGGPDTELIMKNAAILDRSDTFPSPLFSTAVNKRSEPASTALPAGRCRAPDITIAREAFHAQP